MPACPALLIGAPASGQGKTTITAGLARLHRRQGRRVRVFKAGPDFLDPTILSRASGAPVLSLDLWMVGDEACRALLAQAACEADVILIEGVMGLFDGTPSSADIAAAFRVPVAAVISAKAMAQTFGALAFGLARYRDDVPFHGVLANHVASPLHARMLVESLPADLRWLGHVAASDEMALPARHLGLHGADEIANLDARLDCAADALAQTALAELPAPVAFASAQTPTVAASLAGTHIAVARDAAFSFIYPANLALLEALGASISFFSPLADEALPDADALYLPGGYPELHAAALARCERTGASIREHAASGKPIVAECGGMLYLLEKLTDAQGATAPMLGLLPGHATMQARLAALGMQQLDTRHGSLRGHTFHYSRISTPLEPIARATRPSSSAPGEAVFRHGSIFATYMHGYWPSNPELAAALFSGEFTSGR
ncbi:cobyrinate a,c-diamide synthase [Trinickia caryophylli]|uniref:Cobyrinate a,c-diamide synthase n=1 Tax=Trinickia caryophylli TaxID=28094 RepID=A0A1X7GHY5_TRICW|nr:cobyrinate a,c-diamide synthase [Trinickia caryophylli]PMS09867.1 cobyrinate a,c-diamide synthase [Trinickia caryophylli]TRX14902.1 cobyrinate a,c-diamide synthase [Trinickia caryophylli]WQE14752.1 cobyrinate a,c-diamide synthase [Trinickia caryophylli]SMF70167.1 hydrogenobyrinic acid a,c-diamide synthase (glutamine-hydrolysing) /cobyrinate a,c-diamide synthase [Trinickia caryophylli]GLU34950.1 hydrogenobyrinate a,c-diamide synthase [Trinickia caryophylli]